MVHNKNYANFDYQKCLMFGSLISATDPGKNADKIPFTHFLTVLLCTSLVCNVQYLQGPWNHFHYQQRLFGYNTHYKIFLNPKPSTCAVIMVSLRIVFSLVLIPYLIIIVLV